MKPLPLVVSFLPLVAFSLLTRLLPAGDFAAAALTAAVLAVAGLVVIRPNWPPKILGSCSAVLFAVLAACGFAGGPGTGAWLSAWAGAGAALVIGLAILALLPLMPFTEQFARLSTPKAYWGSPTFKQINRVLSAAWGLAMVAAGVSRLVGAAVSRHGGAHPGQLILGTVLPVLIIIYMLRFSQSYPARVAGAHPAAAGPGAAGPGSAAGRDR